MTWRVVPLPTTWLLGSEFSVAFERAVSDTVADGAEIRPLDPIDTVFCALISMNAGRNAWTADPELAPIGSVSPFSYGWMLMTP